MMFENMHPDWIPYKQREEKALELFKEGLALLAENKKNHFGLTMGDTKFVLMCHTKNKDDEFKAGVMHVEDEQTGKTFLGLLHFVEDILERHGLVVAIYEGHDFYQSCKERAK